MTTQFNIHPFYGGPFSQWAACDFNLLGKEFNCAEQAMMYSKATLFNDTDSAVQIMETADPHRQKKLGRLVENFDFDDWMEICREIVTVINVAKFSQHPTYLTHLKDTATLTLVEASPSDKIWGVGLAVDDPLVMDPNNWNGTNWLGDCIMVARQIILNPDVINITYYKESLEKVEKIFNGVY